MGAGRGLLAAEEQILGMSYLLALLRVGFVGFDTGLSAFQPSLSWMCLLRPFCPCVKDTLTRPSATDTERGGGRTVRHHKTAVAVDGC